MTELKQKQIIQAYLEKFGAFPLLISLDPEALAKQLEKQLKLDERLPDDFDWFKGLPNDADL